MAYRIGEFELLKCGEGTNSYYYLWFWGWLPQRVVSFRQKMILHETRASKEGRRSVGHDDRCPLSIRNMTNRASVRRERSSCQSGWGVRVVLYSSQNATASVQGAQRDFQNRYRLRLREAVRRPEASFLPSRCSGRQDDTGARVAPIVRMT